MNNWSSIGGYRSMKTLIHFQPMFHFYTPWKHQCDVFRGYRTGTLVENRLILVSSKNMNIWNEYLTQNKQYKIFGGKNFSQMFSMTQKLKEFFFIENFPWVSLSKITTEQSTPSQFLHGSLKRLHSLWRISIINA